MTLASLHKFPDRKNTLWQKISDNLILHKASGVYYVRKYHSNKGRIFKTTECSTKGLAQTKANTMVAEWLYGKPKQDKHHSKLISELCEELEKVLKKEFENGDRRKTTWNHDRYCLNAVTNYFGNIETTKLDEVYWDTWVRNEGRRLGRNLFDISKYLSKLFTFAYSRKYVTHKPRFRNPDREKKSGMIYENSDIEKFIHYSEPLLRDAIIIAAECGLRPHENQGLKWEWIDFQDDRVIIHIPDNFSKTGKGRSLEASLNVANLLRVRLAARTGPYVFPSLTDSNKAISSCQFSRFWKDMLIKVNEQRRKEGKKEYPAGIKFHWLRHSFFTKALLDAKLPLAEVSQYGGNSPGILMKRYLQDDPNRTRSVARAVNLNLGKMKEL